MEEINIADASIGDPELYRYSCVCSPCSDSDIRITEWQTNDILYCYKCNNLAKKRKNNNERTNT